MIRNFKDFIINEAKQIKDLRKAISDNKKEGGNILIDMFNKDAWNSHSGYIQPNSDWVNLTAIIRNNNEDVNQNTVKKYVEKLLKIYELNEKERIEALDLLRNGYDYFKGDRWNRNF